MCEAALLSGKGNTVGRQTGKSSFMEPRCEGQARDKVTVEAGRVTESPKKHVIKPFLHLT